MYARVYIHMYRDRVREINEIITLVNLVCVCVVAAPGTRRYYRAVWGGTRWITSSEPRPTLSPRTFPSLDSSSLSDRFYLSFLRLRLRRVVTPLSRPRVLFVPFRRDTRHNLRLTTVRGDWWPPRARIDVVAAHFLLSVAAVSDCVVLIVRIHGFIRRRAGIQSI